MNTPQAITTTKVNGVTATRKRLQDECRHLRGCHEVSVWFWNALVCNDCGKPKTMTAHEYDQYRS
jgi:hypothetical protein